jgi:3-methyladenine DNA glycosylase AlkC
MKDDKEVWVREKVGGNPSTPPEILASMKDDKEVWVREKVGGNPSTPPEILASMKNDKEVRVRKAVGRNPNTPTAKTSKTVDTPIFEDENRDNYEGE